MKKFISTERKGFKITFENQLTVSVQWGPENYCDNKCFTIEEFNRTDFSHSKDYESDTAEVAIMYGDLFINPSFIGIEASSNVIGYASPEEVINIMNIVKNTSDEYIEYIKDTIKSLYNINPDV